MMVGRRLLSTGLAALTLALVVAGCGSDPDEDAVVSEATTSSSPATQSPSPVGSESPDESSSSQEPSPPAEPEETEESAEPQPAEAAPVPGIRGNLLTAAEVPGFNDEFSWREKSTRMREGDRPFGTCHKFAMTSIGAMKATVRRFSPAVKSPSSSASNLVARFADEMTAKRAFEVLKSWREQCKDELAEYDRSQVGKLEPVPVDGDAVGSWYLLVYGPAGDPDSAYFDAQGLTRVGRTISVVQMRLVGQDYNYRAGKEPMVAAVQAAAARIG